VAKDDREVGYGVLAMSTGAAADAAPVATLAERSGGGGVAGSTRGLVRTHIAARLGPRLSHPAQFRIWPIVAHVNVMRYCGEFSPTLVV
jgi:hypothetical protein